MKLAQVIGKEEGDYHEAKKFFETDYDRKNPVSKYNKVEDWSKKFAL